MASATTTPLAKSLSWIASVFSPPWSVTTPRTNHFVPAWPTFGASCWFTCGVATVRPLEMLVSSGPLAAIKLNGALLARFVPPTQVAQTR